MGRWRLVVAGILVVVGLALVANRWFSSSIEEVPTATLGELRALRGRPKLVAPRSLALDWDKRRYRARSRDELYATDPRTPIAVADPSALRERAAELTGSIVTIGSAPAPKTYFFEKKENRLTGKRESTATSLYAPVEGSGATVWIVSERLKNEQDPKATEFLARTSHTGRVVSLFDVYDGALLAQAYGRKGGRSIPPAAIALDTEEPVAAAEEIATWVPFANADDVWAVFPGTPSANAVHLGPRRRTFAGRFRS